MGFSLTTRVTFLVAMIIGLAFMVLAMIVHTSTTRTFIEFRQEVHQSAKSGHPTIPSRLLQQLEAAFSTGGWGATRQFVATSPEVHDFGQRLIIIDEELEVQVASWVQLDAINVSRLGNRNYNVSINLVEGSSESSLELETPAAFPLTDRDGAEFGRMIVLPASEDPVAGEKFAGEVWRESAVWLLLTLATSMLLTFLLLRHSLKPIDRIAWAASELETGNIPEPIEMNGSREIQNLISAFNSASKSIAETSNLRKQLISDIAHELRTPLTNIKGQLEAAKEGLISDSSDLFKTLSDETQMLERLVDDFQQLSLSDAGGLKIRRQSLPLASLVGNILQPIAAQRSAVLRIEIPDNVHVFADEVRVRQLLGNLMENSMRHKPEGLVVQVNAEESKDAVALTFSDNGPGISKLDQPHVFERFYRAEKSRNRSTGGSGLGLSIARALCEAMDGSIKLDPDNQLGARFEIQLPKG